MALRRPQEDYGQRDERGQHAIMMSLSVLADCNSLLFYERKTTTISWTLFQFWNPLNVNSELCTIKCLFFFSIFIFPHDFNHDLKCRILCCLALKLCDIFIRCFVYCDYAVVFAWYICNSTASELNELLKWDFPPQIHRGFIILMHLVAQY